MQAKKRKSRSIDICPPESSSLDEMPITIMKKKKKLEDTEGV